MRKSFSLAAQITVIFTAAFILTSLLLGVLITRRLDSIYEDTVYERLEAETKSVRLSQRNGEYETAENIAYIIYIKDDNTYYTSANLMPFVDGEAINLLIGKALEQTSNQSRHKNTVNGKVVYYVIYNYQGVLNVNNRILITLTDGAMKQELIRGTRRQIYFISLIAFSLGYVIVLIWITKFADDTRKISNALKKIGKNHYKTKISTKRKDEIGELVQNIEKMRETIIDNEKSRQEVIQGVSHDLKTPIALISSYAEAYNDGMCDASEMADVVDKEAKRLNAKITKLLNLTRLGYIDTSIKTYDSTDMRKLVEELIKLYSYQDEIKFIIEANDSMFDGDYESWYIAVQNILDNAMRYAKSKIEIKLKGKSLSIYNDGNNIQDDVLENIFNAYAKGRDGKSGIGLSIVKRTVDIFGYNIKAENDDNGVTFIIYKSLKEN